tara:strand:+ start:566 stop:1015 length:450 start_codon:yes stop_codon:yes gene_type:complete
MYKSTFDRIGYQIEALQIDCDKQEVYYKTMITTHEVTIGQQSIQLKKAQEIVEDNLNTILRLQMELRTSDAEVDSLLEQNEILYSLVPDGAIEEPFVPVRTIPTDEYSMYLASGRGMQQYPFNPEGEKEAYPYTHPIREIPDYSRVKVK